MVYIIWEVFALILSKARINKRKAAFILLMVLWLLMAIRSIYMGISDTSGVYLSAFLKCKSYSLNRAISESIFINEPLMTFITWICSKILSYQFFLALCSLFTISSFYRFISKNTIKPIYGGIVFFALLYFYESYLIKQMMALAVVLFAFDALREKKVVKYIIFIGIAGLIHKSAFILIPVYFICKYIKFNKWFFTFIGIGIFAGIFMGNSILNILYRFSFYNFESYIKNGIYGSNGKINMGMFIYILITFFCFYYTRKEKENENYNDYLILMFIGCVLNSWSTVVVEFYRIAFYFICPVCVLLPNAMENVPKRYYKIVKTIILLLLCLYAINIAYKCNCIPYHTFIFD